MQLQHNGKLGHLLRAKIATPSTLPCISLPRSRKECCTPSLKRSERRRQDPLRASIKDTTGDSSLADLQTLLEDAVRQEDYKRAALLRDELTQKQNDSRSAVEDANRRFYDAFRHNNMRAMNDIWGNGEHIQCIHPTANCLAGREHVMESWKMVLRGPPMSITLEDVRVYASDSMGYVTCVEVMEAGDSRGRTAATNVFEKQNGRWVIVHHHGSPAPIFV